MSTDKMPENHPMPYRSVLWNHLPKIDRLRKSRRTWRQITDILREEDHVHIRLGTVFNFYKRYRSRDGRPLPDFLRDDIEASKFVFDKPRLKVKTTVPEINCLEESV